MCITLFALSHFLTGWASLGSTLQNTVLTRSSLDRLQLWAASQRVDLQSTTSTNTNSPRFYNALLHESLLS
ncbi:hypothetical protein TorRG33x02_194990 [Trema orientale]|uniref:Secreted protein n=1 Tax=Trema orientale TaxID=63057 RepID=A0A2P5EGL9_TREOI|nr:hypothetical protein TorRG33x02_194990 [Trema orientale]